MKLKFTLFIGFTIAYVIGLVYATFVFEGLMKLIPIAALIMLSLTVQGGSKAPEKPRNVGQLLKHAEYNLSTGAYEKIRRSAKQLKLGRDELLQVVLINRIRLKVYEIGDSGEMAILDVISSSTGNPTEEALQYIENL